MSVVLLLNQSGASLRNVPLPPLVQSNGTSACTNESGRTFFFELGGVDYGSGGSLSVISAAAGLYTCNFSASKISTTGQGSVYYSSGTALPARTPIEVVKYDSFDSMRYGLFAFPNSAPNVSGGLPQLGTDYGSLFTVGVSNIKGATYSSVTFDGVNRINSSVTPANATYSAITLRLDAVDYSSTVTVGVGNIKAAAYSGVSVEVKSGGIQTTSVGVGNYSGVSLEVKTGGIQTTSVGIGTYSGVTHGIDNIKANAYSGVTVDGAKFLSTAGERSAASSLLSTNVGNTRLVQEYLWPLRNRVQISGSTMTVYMPDDTTSSWTASITTGTSSLNGIDPAG